MSAEIVIAVLAMSFTVFTWVASTAFIIGKVTERVDLRANAVERRLDTIEQQCGLVYGEMRQHQGFHQAQAIRPTP